MTLSNKKILLISLFIVFIFLRLFVDSPYILLAADSLKFLDLAKHFPYHTLSNEQLYLLHAPFYPYVIHFVNLLINEDYLAAIAINLVAACITFFVLYKFFMLLTGNFKLTFVMLLFYTLSVDLIIASHKVTRESFVILLLVSAIYFYAKGVKSNNKKSLIAASIFGGILGVTTDHVIFLFPSFAMSYLFLNSKKISFRKLNFPNLKYAILPVAVTLLLYASWLGIRAYQYSTHEYYPAGLEGAPLKTKGFGLIELINPLYFDDFEPNDSTKGDFVSRLKNYAFTIGYIFNMEPFSIPGGLNFTTMKFLLFPRHVAYMFVIYLPLAIAAACGFLLIFNDSIKTGKIHGNSSLYVISLLLIFIFPITQRATSQRYIYPAYIFFFYVLAYGAVALSGNIGIFKKNTKMPAIVIAVAILLLVPVWHYSSNNFVFSIKKIVTAQKTGEFISKNIKKTDAIMAQPGYTYKLIYMAGNRVISMPPKAQDLLPFIEYYNISYVVFGRYYTVDKYHYSSDSAELIKSSPGRFKLIATIKENYTLYVNPKDPAGTDEVYIYKIVKDNY